MPREILPVIFKIVHFRTNDRLLSVKRDPYLPFIDFLMNELFDQIGSSSIFYIRVTKEILFPKQKIVLLPKRLIWWMFSVDLVMDESWLISSLREALPQKINSVLFEEERASKGELDLEIGLERVWQFQSSNTRIFEPRTCQTPTQIQS